MVLSSTKSKLSNAVRESLKATERWDGVGMAVLEEFVVFIKFITKNIQQQEFLTS
jgi:hypothetical protein